MVRKKLKKRRSNGIDSFSYNFRAIKSTNIKGKAKERSGRAHTVIIKIAELNDGVKTKLSIVIC